MARTLDKDAILKEVRRKSKLLKERRRRLEKAIEKEPENISIFGLKELRNDIPKRIDPNLTARQLKAIDNDLDILINMKTATVTGARKHQDEMLRLMLKLPKDDKLSANQKKEMNDLKVDIAAANTQGFDFYSEFWKAFTAFKDKMNFAQLPSDQLLELFSTQKSQITGSTGTFTLDGIRDEMDKYVGKYYENIQKKEREASVGGITKLLG